MPTGGGPKVVDHSPEWIERMVRESFDELLVKLSSQSKLHWSEELYRDLSEDGIEDIYDIINSYHFFCKLCEQHFYTYSVVSDINSFFQKHLNTSYHRQLRKLDFPSAVPMFTWKKKFRSGMCNLCQIPDLNAYALQTKLKPSKLMKLHVCIWDKENRETNGKYLRKLNSIKKYCGLKIFQDKFLKTVQGKVVCLLCCVVLPFPVEKARCHLESDSHFQAFYRFLQNSFNLSLKDILNGFLLEKVTRDILTLCPSPVFEFSNEPELYLDEIELCKKLSNDYVNPYSGEESMNFSPRHLEKSSGTKESDSRGSSSCFSCDPKLSKINSGPDLNIEGNPSAAPEEKDSVSCQNRSKQIMMKERLSKMEVIGEKLVAAEKNFWLDHLKDLLKNKITLVEVEFTKVKEGKEFCHMCEEYVHFTEKKLHLMAPHHAFNKAKWAEIKKDLNDSKFWEPFQRVGNLLLCLVCGAVIFNIVTHLKGGKHKLKLQRYSCQNLDVPISCAFKFQEDFTCVCTGCHMLLGDNNLKKTLTDIKNHWPCPILNKCKAQLKKKKTKKLKKEGGERKKEEEKKVEVGEKERKKEEEEKVEVREEENKKEEEKKVEVREEEKKKEEEKKVEVREEEKKKEEKKKKRKKKTKKVKVGEEEREKEEEKKKKRKKKKKKVEVKEEDNKKEEEKKVEVREEERKKEEKKKKRKKKKKKVKVGEEEREKEEEKKKKRKKKKKKVEVKEEDNKKEEEKKVEVREEERKKEEEKKVAVSEEERKREEEKKVAVSEEERKREEKKKVEVSEEERKREEEKKVAVSEEERKREEKKKVEVSEEERKREEEKKVAVSEEERKREEEKKVAVSEEERKREEKKKVEVSEEEGKREEEKKVEVREEGKERGGSREETWGVDFEKVRNSVKSLLVVFQEKIMKSALEKSVSMIFGSEGSAKGSASEVEPTLKDDGRDFCEDRGCSTAPCSSLASVEKDEADECEKIIKNERKDGKERMENKNYEILIIKGIPKHMRTPSAIQEKFMAFGKVRHVLVKKKSAIVAFAEAGLAGKVAEGSSPYGKAKISLSVSTMKAYLKGAKPPSLAEEIVLLLRNPLQLTDFVLHLVAQAVEMAESPAELKRENLVCSTIIKAVSKKYPNCRCYPFGSRLSGLTLGGHSDLDVFLDCGGMYDGCKNTSRASARNLINKVARLMRVMYEVTDIVVVSHARVPIVTFLHKPTLTHCDVSLKNGLSVQNTLLVKFMVSLDWRVRPLILFIKYWAKCNDLHGPPNFSSYAIVMLVIYYLEQLECPILPTIESLQSSCKGPRMTIGGWDCTFSMHPTFMKTKNKVSFLELLLGFFEFFSSLDYELNVISPLTGTLLPRQAFSSSGIANLPMSYKRHALNLPTPIENLVNPKIPICVVDPFDLSHVLTKSFTPRNLKTFVHLCQESAKCLRMAMELLE